MHFDFIWSNAHTETNVMDAQTGLFIRITYEVEPEAGRFARWVILIEFGALGIEAKRGMYVDADRNGTISDFEKQNHWVMLAQRVGEPDKLNQTITNRYRVANSNKTGIMLVNSQVGKEIDGTVEAIDMGDGLFEKFPYEIELSDDLREIGRTTKNSQGAIVMRAKEEEFDFGKHLSTVRYATAWGDVGIAFVDTQSSLNTGYDYEDAEVAPGIYDTEEGMSYTDRGVFSVKPIARR